jgi:hypothetical protein
MMAQTTRRLVFANWEELQTRLVLLPRVEEEGTGAIVQSFAPASNAKVDSAIVEENPAATEASANDATTATDAVDKLTADPCSLDPEGYELLGVETKKESEAVLDVLPSAPGSSFWRELDFGEILAEIRGAPTPLVLIVGKLSSEEDDDTDSTMTIEFDEKKEDEPPCDDDGLSQHSSPSSQAESLSVKHEPYVLTSQPLTGIDSQSAKQPPQQDESASSGLFGDLSSSVFWSSSSASRANKVSSALATSAAALLAQAKERAASATATGGRLSTVATTVPSFLSREKSLVDCDEEEHDDDDGPRLGLYLHTSLGAWLPVPPPSTKRSTEILSPLRSSPTTVATTSAASLSSSSSSERFLTNSSMIAVRVSEADPVRDPSVRYQWYRSRGSGPGCPLSSSSTSAEVCQSTVAEDRDDGWAILSGAVNAAFQPTACEVGHRLRCVVTMCSKTIDRATENNDNTSSDDEENSSTKEIVLETKDAVRAAVQLFNGSRLALARAAQFSGLEGRGKLEGRSFLLKVGIGMTKKSRRITAAVTVYQVSGQTAEPIHDEETPILGVSARVPDHSNAKCFELIFTRGIPDSAPMVKALATENLFMLQSPNRISRESLLLTLGVANYAGQPVELNERTVLYASPSVDPPSPDDDVSSCSSFASCESLTGSQRSFPKTEKLSCEDDEGFATANSSLDPFPSQTPRHTLSNGSPMSSDRPPTASPSVGAHRRSLSVDCTTAGESDLDSRDAEKTETIRKLEEELLLVRDKLDRKNKVVSELQRSVTQTQISLSAAQRQVKTLEARLGQNEVEHQRISQALRLAEKRISHHEEAVRRIRSNHDSKVAAATSEIASQSSRIAELEKSVRILQNDKSVLSAALEARDGKLSKMAALQQSYDSLAAKVTANESLQNELESMSKRYKDKCSELTSALELQLSKHAELDDARSEIASLMAQREREKSIVSSHQSEHEQLQIKIQKLTAERNNYKQKSESLSKEMARVCKNGRTIREIEKVLAEEASRSQEIEVLREQKKKATDEVHRYQILYEQARRVQLMAGIDCDVSKVLERNEELERLLSELTEYVSAKEMQLETMKQVNDALQAEIRDLAKINMSKNDV